MRIVFQASPLAATLCLALAASAAAAPTAEEWTRILNLSGRQRMLTQKMAKEALFVTADVRTDALRSDLAETTRLFETTLAGLRDGDASTGLPATENARIVKQLDKVQGMYLELKPLFDTVAQGGVLSASELEMLAAKNAPLLKEMNKAVKMYERGAKKVLRGDTAAAVVINLAGKQRMLTQKMTKEAMLVHLGVAIDENRLNLRETTALFARTLAGLLDGDVDLELPGTGDSATRSQLEKVARLWSDLQPLYAAIAGGDSIPKSELEELSIKNVSLLVEMNKAVALFARKAL